MKETFEGLQAFQLKALRMTAFKFLGPAALISAGLDVFEGEPPSADNKLLYNPACILTPHIAAGTRDALEQKLAAVFANISSFFNGDSLENEVDLHSHQD